MNHQTCFSMEQQKVRYEMRNEIETILKESHIDRTKFHEASKKYYDKIIRTLYYTYCDYKKYPAIQTAYMWTRFRDHLKMTELIKTDWDDWEQYIGKLDMLIPENAPTKCYYLLVDGGWVYEGILLEIKKVLLKYPISMDDFYLFPKDYSWLINHCDDGGCMYRVWKQCEKYQVGQMTMEEGYVQRSLVKKPCTIVKKDWQILSASDSILVLSQQERRYQ